MNFVRDFVATRDGDTIALTCIDAAGQRREWTFAEIVGHTHATARLLAARGVGRGDVVMTMCGARIEWVLTLLACLHLGAVAAPCSPMLRAADLRVRAEVGDPVLVVADDAHEAELAAAGLTDVVWLSQWQLDPGAEPPAYAELADTDRAFLLFTSGSTGTPKPVWHGHRYVRGQQLQAEHWLGARPGDVVWSTAAPGWSKSTRNSFIAPWLCGARAVLSAGRFDPAERLRIAQDEQVSVWCMAPTEWRKIANSEPSRAPDALRRLVAAGEPLDAGTLETWRALTGLTIADGYGQTETGHTAAALPGDDTPPGSVGRPLPGIVTRLVDDELQIDATTIPTLSLVAPEELVEGRWWPTGDLFDVDDAGNLFFRTRADDVILSAGYRIDPVEVEKSLRTHRGVADCLVAGVPDDERGEVVAALIVAREEPADEAAFVADVQEHVRTVTAPYKYPRKVRLVADLPRTSTGKPARGQARELLR